MRLPQTLRRPTPDAVRECLREFDGHPTYYGAEAALTKLFRTWPQNTAEEEVLLKVVALDRMYSTNVWQIWATARHIVAADVDPRLREGDLTLVRTIARPPLEKPRCLYSFATKYCSWHRPEVYPIYDSFVERVLWIHQKQWAFSRFRRSDMGTYKRFCRIHADFQRFFGLDGFSRKELDKFLWIMGKRAFG